MFGADAKGNGYRFDVDAGVWELVSVTGGRRTVLAKGKQQVLPASEPVEVRIKHHPWLLSVALNGGVVAEVQDDSQGKGLVAVGASKSSPAGKPLVQPLNEVKFAENFMRTEEEIDLSSSKIWHIAGGKWQIHSVREDADTVDVDQLPESRRPQKDRSHNPFSVSAFAEQSGLLWGGRWFWDDYHASASVRNLGAEAVGLAFNVQDKDDYFLLRWENDSPVLDGTPIELVRVKNGKHVRIHRAWVNGQMKEWFTLGVRTTGTRIQALLDEAVIMDVRHPESVGGGIGVYVEGGGAKKEAFFDDIGAKTIGEIEFTDEAWILRHARQQEGQWATRTVKRPGRPDCRAPAIQKGNGQLVLGNSRWPAPMLSTRVPVPKNGQQVGFVGALNGPGDRSWRVALGRNGNNLSLSIEREEGSQRKALASCADVPLPEDDSLQLEVDFTREAEISVLVDGELQLHAHREGSAVGAPAIFARNADGILFRDLTVFFRRPEDKERLPAEEVFREDPYMQHWSSAQGSWWPQEGSDRAFWHVGDFYGRSDIEIPLSEDVLLIHAAEEISPESGYAFEQEQITKNELKFYRLTLRRKGKKIAECTVEEQNVPDDTIVLHKDGRYLWVTAGTRELCSFRDPQPLPGTRLAVQGIDGENLGDLTIHRYQVRDYYFESAPSDWLSVGLWKVTNRFVCDPRWSHMAAMSESAGILFNKYKYRGDLTMEAFMGMRMRPSMRNYPRVGDLNMSMLTRPFDLSSGYSFVLAGWDNFWNERDTYLLKSNRQVAYCGERLLPAIRRPGEKARVIEVPWIRDGRAVHGAWYYVKARKQGGKLKFYVDNRKAYEYEDPEPFREVSPAIWTYDSWVVIARVKVSYEEKVVPGRLVDAPQEGRPEGTGPPLRLSSSTHPGLQENFESGAPGWEKYNELHGGHPSLVKRTGGGHALKVTNERAGGTFAVEAPVSDLNLSATAASRLRFDYRIPPGSKINLYMDIGGERYFLRMTGPGASDTRLRRLGEIPVKADGKWHTAEFNVAAAYRDMHRGDETGLIPIRQTIFGNLHEGLLDAGLEGNPTNAAYYIDNFELAGTGGPKFEAAAQIPGKDVAQTLVAFDHEPGTVPQQAGKPSKDGLSPGLWYCHVRAKLKDGTLSSTRHHPFVVQPAKITVRSTEPGNGNEWGYGPIRLQLGPGQALQIHESKLGLKVNGKEVQTYPELFHLDCASDTLRIELARAALEISDGKPCQLLLSHPHPDGSTGSLSLQLTPNRATDKTPPGKVKLVGLTGNSDFETDAGAWAAADGTQIVRDDDTAAEGDYSLMVQNMNFGGSMMAYAIKEGFHVGRTPLIEFDYKVHQAVQIDLGLHNAAGTCTVGFTDRGNGGHYLGALENVRADNRWHRAEVNMLERLQKVPFRAGLYKQSWLALADYGYQAAAPGAYYHIDNFRQVPLISPRMNREIRVEAHDAGGIKGYSYKWSAMAEEEPDNRIDEGRPGELPAELPTPDAYLHVKACDRAGNWGPTAHFRFRADTGAPEIAGASPSAGQKSASSTISFRVTDGISAVDPDSLKVEIDGRTYGPSSRGVEYNPESGEFVWDWVTGAPQSQKGIPDGKDISVKVQSADFAANPAEPVVWKWKMDYSADKQTPTVPRVTSVSMPVKERENFAKGDGQWRPMRNDVWGAQIKRIVRDRSTRDHCLRISARRGRSFMNVYAHQGKYDLEEYPLVSFDYMIPNAARFNMFVQLNGKWHEVLISSKKAKWTKLGELEGIKTNGRWHHVVVNLLDLVQKARPNAGNVRVQRIAFGDNSRQNSRKSYWLVDNFMISGYGEPEASFEWSARDITGIAGYAAALLESSTDELKKEITHKDGKGTFKPAGAGTHWLKVRARDNAGNWGPSVTVPYLTREPQKKAETK
jgi:hypothetical protein